MTGRMIVLVALANVLAGVEQAAEWAAWAPLASRVPELVADEARPVVEESRGWHGQVGLFAGTSRRLRGSFLVEREPEESFDAQATLSYLLLGEHGATPSGWFGPAAQRAGWYLRLGTDPGVEQAADPVAALGWGRWTGANVPIGLWTEIQAGDERGFAGRLDLSLCVFHVEFYADDEQTLLAYGLQQRWPGGPLAPTVDQPPVGFLIRLDALRAISDRGDRNGVRLEGGIDWRCTDHLLVGVHLVATDLAVDADGQRHSLVTASLGLGYAF